MGSQVKPKQRIADHGEVFTAEREENAMLDDGGNVEDVLIIGFIFQ